MSFLPRDLVKEKYAQKPSLMDRRIIIDEAFPDYIIRNEFSRDRDRIIFSKAFRRLEHKAQVYSHSKGDHYRTRLTHTIEVMQIARSVAINLGLCEDLTEAIAWGHDIGHTPFGHQGEDVLDNIMRGKDDLGIIKFKLHYGGFKHNFNGLRTIDILERKYKDEKGLNLTWQVIDGILKHTKIEKEDKTWTLNRFIQDNSQIEAFYKYHNPVTLEGQIVAIADEITQRQHDLDDGLRDTDLKLDENTIINYIQSTISDIIDKTEELLISRGIVNWNEETRSSFKDYVKNAKPSDILNDDNKYISKLIGDKNYIGYDLYEDIITARFISEYIVSDYDEIKLLRELETKILQREETNHNEIIKGKLDFEESTKLYLWYSLIRDIIDYFIKDVTLNSSKNLLKIENNELYDDDKNKISVKYKKNVNSDYKQKFFDSKIVDFSMSGKEFDKKLEEYIQNQILNSYNVNRFDGKAIYIVRQLFKAYYTNPRQMPSTTLDKLSERLQENSEKYGSELILIDSSIDEVNFRTSRPKDIAELIKLLKLEFNQKELENIFNLNFSYEYELKLDIDFLGSIGGDLTSFNPNCEECDENYNNKILFGILKKVNDMDLKSIKSKNNEKRAKLLFIKCILEHHYVYLSLICDHIAGMTDNYANSEYEKLYLV